MRTKDILSLNKYKLYFSIWYFYFKLYFKVLFHCEKLCSNWM